MWRGYGGNGAALVFDPAKIAWKKPNGACLHEGQGTRRSTGQMREDWLQRRIAESGKILAKSAIPGRQALRPLVNKSCSFLARVFRAPARFEASNNSMCPWSDTFPWGLQVA
jgi:hypothetical protein